MEEKRVIEISTGTIIKIFIALGIVSLAIILQDVIVLVLIAFILAAALNPVVIKLEKKGLPRFVSVISAYAIFALLIYFLLRAIFPTLINQIDVISMNRQYYIDKINDLLSSTSVGFQASAKDILSQFSHRAREFSVNGILSGALGIFSGFLGFITILVLVFYFLLDRDGVENIIARYLPDNYKKRGLRVYKKICRNMSLWFRGQLFLSLVVGIISFAGLLIIGVDFALTLAVIASFTELIPVIGPIIGGIPAVTVALIDSPTKALYVLVLYVVVQFMEGHFLVPQIMKKSLGLSPVFIIISILIGARLFGILGVILAIPVASALSVVVEEIREYDRIEEEERQKLEKKKS